MHIYKSQVRGNLEYCSTVWHSGLTEAETKDIEQVQKAAVKIIMGNLDSLKERRLKMAQRFAKRSLKLEQFSILFPLNDTSHLMTMRNPDRYIVNVSNTIVDKGQSKLSEKLPTAPNFTLYLNKDLF